MAERILVLGGTRYFGKRLVQMLVESGADVTIATRGRTQDPFGDRVKRVKLDREDPATFETLRGTSWDLIYDQVCYSPSAAAISCEVFKDRVGRYIHTSTQSVYLNDGLQKEADFDPKKLAIQMGKVSEFSYSDAKRFAEAVFFQKATFPVVAVRFPIVLGPDDYTRRLEFHINAVKFGNPILVSNPQAEACFIASEEAARFLFWLRKQSYAGPVNACSSGKITITEILNVIECVVGKKALVVDHGEDEDRTPFVGDVSRYMDHSRAESLGFHFLKLQDWLPALVEQLAK